MTNLDELVAEAINIHHSAQKPKELAALGQLILDRGYKTAIEIGTWGGGTSWFLWSLGLSVTTIDDCDETFLRECLAGHGMEPLRIPAINYIVGDGKQSDLGIVDVVFIDGNHTYGGVKSDWEHWRSRVNPGGIVILHDVIADVPENSSMVKSLFDEISVEYKTTAFIDPTDDGYPWGGFDPSGNRRPWGGIGVIHI